MLGPPHYTNPPEEPEPPPCHECGDDATGDDEDGLPICDECDEKRETKETKV